MSTEEHAAHTDPEFFPENVEFLGFIAGWDCYTGTGTLEAVVRSSNRITSRNCVISVPRQGSISEAAARLLDTHVRSRVHYECPVPPYRPGLVTSEELESIVSHWVPIQRN